MRPEYIYIYIYIYNITLLIYSCILAVYITLYKIGVAVRFL